MTSNKRPRTSRAPTIRDVAKAARVSPATVEFVLNNTPGQTISAPTRQRVLKAVRALGYHPNAAARTLRAGHSRQIAMFNIAPIRPAIGDWMLGLHGRACELGYYVAAYYREGLSDSAWREVLTEVISEQPFGIIAWAPLLKPADRKLLEKRTGPVVYVSNAPVPNAVALFFDYPQVGRAAATHLVQQGHRHVALAGPRNPMFGGAEAMSLEVAGLKAVLDPLGGTVSDLPMEPTFADARRAVDEMRTSPQRPTAVFAHRDEFAIVLLRALQESGLRVPQDVALVSADDTQVCQLVSPTLTSICVHTGKVARQVVDVLDLLAHGKTPDAELLLPLRPEVIVRESS